MSRLPFFALAGIAVFLCAPALIVSSGQEPRVEATGPAGPAATIDQAATLEAVPKRPPDVVLLRNGRVLEGWARKEGDWYVVQRPGAELRLAASSVEMVGRSLEGLYARRRQQVARDDVAGHLALVHWCLRHDLLDEARLELAAVMALEPNHSVAKQLLLRLQGQQRLARSAELREIEEVRGEAEPQQPPGEGVGLFEPTGAERSPAELAEQSGAATSGPPYEWPGLPERAVSEFTRSIQPLLNNSCTTGGCHSAPDRGGFGLIRIRDPRLVTRRATEQNLASVLEWIDPANPNNSEFLAMAVLAHARGPRPQFAGLRGEQFDALARWIDSLEPKQDASDWAARGRARPAAAFQAAMRADAAAPGRRGSNTGRRLSTGHTRTAGVVAGDARGVRVQTHKQSEAPNTKGDLPKALQRPPAGRREPRSLNAMPEPTGRQGVQSVDDAEGGLALPPGPGNPPRADVPSSAPRAAGDDAPLPGGPMVPSVTDAPSGDTTRKSRFSFLKRLNPFRRKK